MRPLLDGEPGYVFWFADTELTKLEYGSRQRCFLCDRRIEPGSRVLKFERHKIPDCRMEVRMYGRRGHLVPRASKFMCFECGKVQLS